MRRLYLGWDVGAWHCENNRASRDALWLLTSEGSEPNSLGVSKRMNLGPDISEFSGRALLERMVRLCNRTVSLSPTDELYIAIDAPLGWPTAFRELLEGQAPAKVGKDFGRNPLIFRQTDCWIGKNARLSKDRKTPLSPVQDQIGSQSTKGLVFLSRIGAARAKTCFWKKEGVTVVETYPTPCRSSRSIEAQLESLLPVDFVRRTPPNDQEDALTCALIAWLFAEYPDRLQGPPPELEIDSFEGWIWIPKDAIRPA